jgi:hypothetical protein
MIANIFVIKAPAGKSLFDNADLTAKFVSVIESKSNNVGRLFSGISVEGDVVRRLDIFEEQVTFSEQLQLLSASLKESLTLEGFTFAFVSGEINQEVLNDVSIFGNFKTLEFENGKLITPLV